MLTRRKIIQAGAAACIIPSTAKAWFPHGAGTAIIFSSPADYVSKKFGNLVSFGMTTFTGQGTQFSSVNQFNPSAYSCAQWAQTFVTAKMKYAVLTVKFIDGFCLWPTATSGANVAQTTWYSSHGNLDIARDFVNTMRAYGIIPCFYFNNDDYYWKGINPGWTQPQFLSYTKAQITELLTSYGPIGAMWFDCGGSFAPFATNSGWRDFVQTLQPACLTVCNALTYVVGVTSDINEFEIYNGSGAITSPNTTNAEEVTTIFAPGTDTPPLSALQGPYFAYTNYACISAASILAEIARVNALNCTYLLSASPNQTGLIDSSVVSVLTTVGAGL